MRTKPSSTHGKTFQLGSIGAELDALGGVAIAVPPRSAPRLAPSRRLSPRVLISALVALLVTAVLVNALVSAPAMQWSVFAQWVFNGVILHGALNTVWLTLLCEALAILSGAALAWLLISSNSVGHVVAHAYQWGFRSVPELAQLLFWFNLSLLFPKLTIGVPFGGPALFSTSMNSVMTPWVAAVVGLGLHEGAYLAEVFRSGILSVDPGQLEVARSLGLRRWTIARRIVLPQAMRVIAPNAGSRLIGTLKLTSLASVVAIPELLYRVEGVYSRTFQTIPLLLVATVWYMAMVAVLRALQAYLERRFPEDRTQGKAVRADVAAAAQAV
jgi:polar amino acid transport system permease protein